MEFDINLDVNVARLTHAEWETELERLAKGSHKESVPHIHANCDLGRWIYGRGLRKYGDFGEIWQLKEVHNIFHSVADDIIQQKVQGRADLATDMLDQVRNHSRDIIYLLTSLELAVLQRKRKTPLLDKTGNFLSQLLGSEPTTKPFPMILYQEPKSWLRFRKKKLSSLAFMLDINAARLNHVQWVQNLQRAFNRLSRGKHIQTADECGLGLWLDAMNNTEFRGDAKFEALDEAHREFHDLSSKTLKALHKQDVKGADDNYQKVILLSQDIVLQLTHIELRLQNSKTLFRRLQSIL